MYEKEIKFLNDNIDLIEKQDWEDLIDLYWFQAGSDQAGSWTNILN